MDPFEDFGKILASSTRRAGQKTPNGPARPRTARPRRATSAEREPAAHEAEQLNAGARSDKQLETLNEVSEELSFDLGDESAADQPDQLADSPAGQDLSGQAHGLESPLKLNSVVNLVSELSDESGDSGDSDDSDSDEDHEPDERADAADGLRDGHPRPGGAGGQRPSSHSPVPELGARGARLHDRGYENNGSPGAKLTSHRTQGQSLDSFAYNLIRKLDEHFGEMLNSISQLRQELLADKDAIGKSGTQDAAQMANDAGHQRQMGPDARQPPRREPGQRIAPQEAWPGGGRPARGGSGKSRSGANEIDEEELRRIILDSVLKILQQQSQTDGERPNPWPNGEQAGASDTSTRRPPSASIGDACDDKGMTQQDDRVADNAPGQPNEFHRLESYYGRRLRQLDGDILINSMDSTILLAPPIGQWRRPVGELADETKPSGGKSLSPKWAPASHGTGPMVVVGSGEWRFRLNCCNLLSEIRRETTKLNRRLAEMKSVQQSGNRVGALASLAC